MNQFDFLRNIFAAIMVQAALLPKSFGSMPVGLGTGLYGKTLPKNTRNYGTPSFRARPDSVLPMPPPTIGNF